MKYDRKHSGHTLIIIIITIALLGFIFSATSNVTKNKEITENVMQKAGLEIRNKLKLDTKRIIKKFSTNKKTFENLKYKGDVFSVWDADASEKLAEIYKKFFSTEPRKTVGPKYLSTNLVDKEGVRAGELRVFDFNKGFLLKNGAYFGIKMNNDCHAKVTTVYDPEKPMLRTLFNSCGLIFYDVNGEKEPNVLEVDQFIFSLDKDGIQ